MVNCVGKELWRHIIKYGFVGLDFKGEANLSLGWCGLVDFFIPGEKIQP